MPKTKPPYPREFRTRAVDLVRKTGKTVEEIANDLGVAGQTPLALHHVSAPNGRLQSPRQGRWGAVVHHARDGLQTRTEWCGCGGQIQGTRCGGRVLRALRLAQVLHPHLVCARWWRMLVISGGCQGLGVCCRIDPAVGALGSRLSSPIAAHILGVTERLGLGHPEHQPRPRG